MHMTTLNQLRHTCQGTLVFNVYILHIFKLYSKTTQTINLYKVKSEIPSLSCLLPQSHVLEVTTVPRLLCTLLDIFLCANTSKNTYPYILWVVICFFTKMGLYLTYYSATWLFFWSNRDILILVVLPHPFKQPHIVHIWVVLYVNKSINIVLLFLAKFLF